MTNGEVVGTALVAFLGIWLMASLFLMGDDAVQEYRRDKAQREDSDVTLWKPPLSAPQQRTEEWLEEQEVA